MESQMKYDDRYGAPEEAERRNVLLTAEETATIAELMRELRDVTLSRRSFLAASDFLRRFAGETESPMLVPADTAH
jgi:hypothetical protein